ncbi:hypothetical protein HDU83_002642 [Entophlyctis luteolus]|nr:hypothetical protein HDU83_002642 [Entophlyctis luteolus]
MSRVPLRVQPRCKSAASIFRLLARNVFGVSGAHERVRQQSHCSYTHCHLPRLTPNGALCPVCRHRILTALRRNASHLVDDALLTYVEAGAAVSAERDGQQPTTAAASVRIEMLPTLRRGKSRTGGFPAASVAATPTSNHPKAVSFETSSSRGEQHQNQSAQKSVSSFALQTPRRSSRLCNTPASVTSPSESQTSSRSSASLKIPQEYSVKRGRVQTRTPIQSTRADSRRIRAGVSTVKANPRKARPGGSKQGAGLGSSAEAVVEVQLDRDHDKDGSRSETNSDSEDACDVAALERRVTRLLTLQNAPIASRLRNRAQA